MLDIECSDSAYSRIKNSKIEQKINEKYEECSGSIEKFFYNKKGEKIIEEARKGLFTNKKISETLRVHKDIARLSSLIEDEFLLDSHIKEICVEHPSFLAYYILGKELFDYKKLNFPSLHSLEESIASYFIKECREEKISYSHGRLVWRNNGKKNVLHRDVHGDMYVSQTDVIGNEKEVRTLFGKEINFDSVKHKPSYGGLYSCQDWSTYLITALKYAKRLGKEKIEEINNWKGYYQRTHSTGFYTEAGDGASLGLKSYIERPIISKGEKLESFPLYIGMGDMKCKFPYFEGNKLFYIAENEYGDIDLSKKGNCFKDKKYKKIIEYSESDLPNMLKGCYKLFSRVVKNMFFIMDDFNKEHLSNKSSRI